MTKIFLESKDNVTFEVEKEVIEISSTIKHLLRDVSEEIAEQPIQLPNVSSEILGKIVEYCNHHATSQNLKNAGKNEDKRLDNIDPWDLEFSKEMSSIFLINMVKASNYLDIPNLQELCSKLIAKKIQGKNIKDVQIEFNIDEELTSEEEANISTENGWKLNRLEIV